MRPVAPHAALFGLVLSLVLEPATPGALGVAPLPFGRPAPGLESVWDSLAPLVTSAMASQQTELEVRFAMHPPEAAGTQLDLAMPSGVPKEAFEHCLAQLQRSCEQGHMTSLGETKVRDFGFSSQVRLSVAESGEQTWVMKRLLSRHDLSATPLPDAGEAQRVCHMRCDYLSGPF
ncbi:hypothetical protein T484DRAFT_1824878 [Baffinella frigidus]|nr:hypothetical protein T484DRAFT_1824878 [Cryptophyta sp. CCMP2293]